MRNKRNRPNGSRAAALLKKELRDYERAGTHLYLDGQPCHAEKIVSACMLSEEPGYMREFIGDDQKKITEIHFVKIHLPEWR
ncbi:MAG: hypothetical protein LUF35_04590 [Lachnospiraceae bacterium]|nr:hypothetical protein [Lachnospiraceae bacterium]